MKPEKTRYAPVEGEALAIAWSLEQTRYFTQGCDNLLVVTNHKPLTALFGDRTLDEITNPRLRSMKQKTLLWRFDVQHKPGKDNCFYVTSPSGHTTHDEPDNDDTSFLASIAIHEDQHDEMETELAALAANEIRAVAWEVVRKESAQDETIQSLSHTIVSGFSSSKDSLPVDVQPFWKFRHDLYIIDGVVLMKRRTVILRSLRPEVLQSLHSAHQGVTSMNERAKVEVYWPDITRDIQNLQDSYFECNRIAPSQARMPPIEPTYYTIRSDCM